MNPPKIVYLPGLFGSTLGYPTGVPGVGADVWLNPALPFSGLILQLQLAADGVSPGPLTYGFALQPTGILQYSYGPLSAYMRARGWNVLEAAYDWRMSVLNTAGAVLTQIQNTFGQSPFIFVCHSMGGLVARAVYRILLSFGLGQQVLGMVTLGTPHWGSWEPVRGFFGLPYLYQALRLAQLIGYPAPPFFRFATLDALVASWPGWYELMPWRDAGPLATADPATAQSLYQLGTYSAGNPFIQQARFDSAVVTQQNLLNAIPPNQIKCVRGYGYVTANEVADPSKLWKPEGYVYDGAGDGQVPQSYATVPTAVILDRRVAHSDMPRDPSIWPVVAWCVQSFAGPGA